MKAAIFDPATRTTALNLSIKDVPRPQVTPGYVLLRVLACGVCRTDLHIVEGDLPMLHQPLIPGHQIVGEVIEGASTSLPLGTRVGVSWMGGTDGDCFFCKHGMENLCDHRPSRAIQSMEGMPNMRSHGKPSPILFRTNSMLPTWRRCSAPALSASAACE
jgi:D-arabinose 1-dehydrogenase-like Zn-dependent alcohol dehydrogenase